MFVGSRLLQLLLGPNVGGVSARLLSAVGGSGVEPGVALAANHLVSVVFLGQNTEGGLNNATTETEHQMQGGLWKKKRNQIKIQIFIQFKVE